MKVILIDDHGNTKELIDDGNVVMDSAKDEYFYPCGSCGHVCFSEDAREDQCKYCVDNS